MLIVMRTLMVFWGRLGQGEIKSKVMGVGVTFTFLF